MKNKNLNDLLELLPARFITKFDELYLMSIFKSKGIWYIKYNQDCNSKAYFQKASIDLRLACLEMLKYLQIKGIFKPD